VTDLDAHERGAHGFRLVARLLLIATPLLFLVSIIGSGVGWDATVVTVLSILGASALAAAFVSYRLADPPRDRGPSQDPTER
jgi:hypothetical protein